VDINDSVIKKVIRILYCTNCGAELKPDAKFCSMCGKRVTEKKEQDRKTFTERDNMGTRHDDLEYRDNVLDGSH